MNASNKTSRRHFLASSTAATTALAAGLVANAAAPDAVAKERAAESGSASSTGETRARNRVGAVAYGYQYSIGLFSYKDRPGEKFDAVRFVEANHEAGGEVAQLFHTMIRDLDEDGLKRLRRRAEELDVMWKCTAAVLWENGPSSKTRCSVPPRWARRSWAARSAC